MNIFARELQSILAAHNRTLSNLFSLPVTIKGNTSRTISPNKVMRLKRSLDHNISTTLNPTEMIALQQWLGLDDDEIRQLKAALIAESVRVTMLGRIDQFAANAAGEFVYSLLLANNYAEFRNIRDSLLESVD